MVVLPPLELHWPLLPQASRVLLVLRLSKSWVGSIYMKTNDITTRFSFLYTRDNRKIPYNK